MGCTDYGASQVHYILTQYKRNKCISINLTNNGNLGHHVKSLLRLVPGVKV